MSDPPKPGPVQQILSGMTLAYASLVRELIQKGHISEAAMVERMQQCVDVMRRHDQGSGVKWLEEATELIRVGQQRDG